MQAIKHIYARTHFPFGWIGGFVLLLLLASCARPQSLEYRDVKNITVDKISIHPVVGMDVLFYNPNKKGMTLKDGNIDLYINDKLVGHAVMQEKYKVPAADTFLLPVKSTADLSGVLSNALQLMSNREVKIRMNGSVKAGRGVLIPIPIRYEGKQKLNVF